MNITLYVPDSKSELIEAAKKDMGESLSATFLRCLERELQMRSLKSERIVVEIFNRATGRCAKKAFRGRWLVGSNANPERFDSDEGGGGMSYAVAQSAGEGAIVVLMGTDAEWTHFDVYDTFEDFKDAEFGHNSGHPESLISAVADALQIDFVQELDI